MCLKHLDLDKDKKILLDIWNSTLKTNNQPHDGGKIMSKVNLDKLKTVVQSAEKPFKILITGVDPDSMGSAFALAALIEFLSGEVAGSIQVCYFGAIGHRQNKTIDNLYNLESMMMMVTDDEDFDNYHVCLVDSCTVADSRMGKHRNSFVPLIVVDHHRGIDFEVGDDQFCWIDEIGACATMLVELMQHYKFELDESDRFIYNMLAIGIYSDTDSLNSAGARDREAFNYVRGFVSEAEFVKFSQYTLPESYYMNLYYAIGRREQVGSKVLTNIGYIDPEEGDDLAMIANQLVRKDGVSMVVVWGIVGGKVRISVRNLDISISLPKWMKERFGDRAGAKMAPDGRAEGGGTIDMEFDKFWLCDDNKAEIIGIMTKKFRTLVFEPEKEAKS